MKNILVPVGTTESGINNLKYAINLASISGGKVFLISVYEDESKLKDMINVNEFWIKEKSQQLKDVINGINSEGVEINAQSIKGNPFEEIKKISKKEHIDLIILSPQSIEIDDEVYLGKTTSKILKQTEIPLLIVPTGFLFRKFDSILFAFKNGQFKKENVLEPLNYMKSIFNSNINLLHVITPEATEESKVIDQDLLAIKSSLTTTENATTFQGVLEHFQSHNPDMLCVIRRRRGFFKKLWEKNSILKRDFHTSKPLLVLSGIQE
ncbi:MAG: nucleotide-binding universal stress UspA family protein [Flavobacteriaceae bacterium]|jgi:nucleotide-binding universal stress UspA family protein